MRRTPFSSLRWLHLTPQKLSRRIQWHQVLLFLLRAAFMALLVLALAKPLLAPAAAGHVRRPLHRARRQPQHELPRRRAGDPASSTATDLAAELVRRNRPGDRTAVLLTGAQTRLLDAAVGASRRTTCPLLASGAARPDGDGPGLGPAGHSRPARQGAARGRRGNLVPHRQPAARLAAGGARGVPQ